MIKKIENIQYILILTLIIVMSLLMRLSEYYSKISFNIYLYYIVLSIGYILLGIILSIPKIIGLKKLKINIKYLIIELFLVLSVVTDVINIWDENLIIFRLISLSFGFFLIDCVKPTVMEQQNIND